MEKLAENHRSDLESQEKKLELVAELGGRQLRSAIIDRFDIQPRSAELSHYVSAIAELTEDLSKLPDAEYRVFLDGVGNYYNLKVGIKGLDTTNIPVLERSVETIYTAVERAGWTSRDPGFPHDQQCVAQGVENLVKNGGDLEYFDRLTFFNHGQF